MIGNPIKYDGDIVFDFDYTGEEQTFTVPVSGTYKLETWGAQGGNTSISLPDNSYSREGGYGGYSSGNVELKKNQEIYIYTGGAGDSTLSDLSQNNFNCSTNTSFNGGGSAFIYNCIDNAGAGGGATHIAKKSGLLSTLENYKSDILIVSGGGGGSYSYSVFAANGGSGGGFKGELPSDLNHGGVCGWERILTLGNKATQFSSGTTSGCYLQNSTKAGFGNGESNLFEKDVYGSGGGGGFYGGGAGRTAYGAGGGSGYIGNSSLTNKVMYCYNCEESNEESTKTISTTCSEETPTSYCAKKGNGYARITLVSID